jgi:hypothetical protein
MSRYAPLLTVEVNHTFFAGGRCRVVDLALVGRSQALVHRSGMVARSAPGRLEVLHDPADRSRLALFSSDPEESFRLDIRVTTRDPGFWSYTEGAPAREAVLAFDSRSASVDPGDGTIRLSKGEVASAEDGLPLGSARRAGLLEGWAPVTPPVALLRLRLADEGGAFLDPPASGTGWRYRLDFVARATYWRYLLLGRLAGGGSTITDPDGVTQFEFVGEELLPGNRKAASFRSTTRLPLEEFSSRRFQLRASGSKGNGNGPILVRRLPAASASSSRRETIAGEAAVVSDILVNG